MNFIKVLIAVAIIAVIFFFVGKSCSKEEVGNPDDPRIAEIEAERDSIIRHSLILQVKVDSLSTLREKVKLQIIYRERQINENIAKDSSNSISEFRQSLTENQELPDNTLYPTYREFGLSAKIMSKVPKLGIIINIQDSIITNKDLIIFDKDYIIEGQKEVIEIKNESITYWQGLYKDETAWYNENWIWLTLGVIVTSGIVIVAGATN
jgi:hypothetical protein